MLDVKATMNEAMVSRALSILTPFVPGSYEARTLYQTISSAKKLSAKQKVRVFGEGGYEARYLDKFGEPPETSVPTREIPGLQLASLASYTARRATKAPQPIQSLVPEDTSPLRAYEEETTPLRRSQAWALEHGIKLIPTASIAPVFPFPMFNPVQSEAFKHLQSSCNLMVCALTSSGKTEILAVYAANAIRSGLKALYLSPMRALSAEKYDLWSDENYLFGGYTVTLHTGDWELTPSRRVLIGKSDLLLFTSEILDSQSRYAASHPEQGFYFQDVGVILCDEAHLLGVEGRGGKLEAALVRLMHQAPNARIVMTSATLKNAAEVGAWLTHISGRETKVIESGFRPTKLGIHFRSYPSNFNYQKDQDARISTALDVAQEFPEDQILMFCHTKRDLRGLVETASQRNLQISTHHADLSKDKRNAVEASFRSGVTRLLGATSTLAIGVNLPARRVVILGTKRGPNTVTPTELQQECGRAGRTGIDTRGDAYLITPSDMMESTRQGLLHSQTVTSELGKAETLAFHILFEIQAGSTKKSQLLSWYAKTLWAYQLKDPNKLETTLEKVLRDLINIDCITEWRPGEYRISELGRISSVFYFSPYDCYDWRSNFTSLWERECWDDDWSLAWAIGDARSYGSDYIPKSLSNVSYPTSKHYIRNGSLPMIAAIYEGIRGRSKDVVSLGLVNWWMQITSDSGRIAKVLSVIQQTFLPQVLVPQYELSIRLKKGVPRNLVPLARIPGIGPEFARRLYDYGVTTVEHVALPVPAVSTLLGARADKIVEAARRLLNHGDDDDE